jgi:two-component system, LytTR family, response regulator
MTKDGIYTLIIDSDPESQKHTKGLLQTIPMVSGIGTAKNPEQALLKIIDRFPDVILIEYPTRGQAGNELINFIKTKLPETIIVFVSDSKEHAAGAIRIEVFNYILKPVSEEYLNYIIEKALLIKQTNIQSRVNQVIEKMPNEVRLKIQTNRGYLVIDPEELLYCRADGVFCEFFLTKDRVELCYLSISKLEEALKPYNFVRISRSYLLNWKYIRKINRNNNTVILSANEKELEIKGSKQIIRTILKLGDT